jgi:hypothetical protein
MWRPCMRRAAPRFRRRASIAGVSSASEWTATMPRPTPGRRVPLGVPGLRQAFGHWSGVIRRADASMSWLINVELDDRWWYRFGTARYVRCVHRCGWRERRGRRGRTRTYLRVVHAGWGPGGRQVQILSPRLERELQPACFADVNSPTAARPARAASSPGRREPRRRAHPRHRKGRVDPWRRQRSRRSGGAPRRIRKRVYFPILPDFVTITRITVPIGSRRWRRLMLTARS